VPFSSSTLLYFVMLSAFKAFLNIDGFVTLQRNLL
jgi:hypothetical protein